MRWGNPSSILVVLAIWNEVCPVGQCWEEGAEQLLNPVGAHMAARMLMECSANTQAAPLPCPLCWTLGSGAEVGWGGKAVARSSPDENIPWIWCAEPQ